MLKDLLYFGLGSAYIAKERLEVELEKLSEKGKISKEEIKDVLEKAKSKGKEEEKNFQNLIKDELKKAITELGIATKEDLDNLKKDLGAK